MTSSWTAHPLLASPRPACSAAERHPSDRGHGRWIFALGPRWVRATAVAHGHQRSLAVDTTHNQRFRRTAGHRPFSSRSRDYASGRFRSWSRRQLPATSRGTTRTRPAKLRSGRTAQDSYPWGRGEGPTRAACTEPDEHLRTELHRLITQRRLGGTAVRGPAGRAGGDQRASAAIPRSWGWWDRLVRSARSAWRRSGRLARWPARRWLRSARRMMAQARVVGLRALLSLYSSTTRLAPRVE
jgi:hypothetical protein